MELLWILKKIVGRLFFPLSLVMALLLIGACWKRRGRVVVLSGAVLLYLFSFAPLAQRLLHPLEAPHAPVSATRLNRDAAWVVVLGGGARDATTLKPEDRLYDASLKRLMEGIRLCRLLPEARLLLSGGNYPGTAPEAVLMRHVALVQGIEPERIVLETDSLDTADQAWFLGERLGGNPSIW